MNVSPEQLINHWNAYTSNGSVERLVASPLINPEDKSSVLFAGKLRSESGHLQRLLLLRLPSKVLGRSSPKFESKGIEVAALKDQRDPAFGYLALSLIADEYHTIFAVLCADVANKVLDASTDKQRFSYFLERLSLWEKLFDKASPDGLSEIEQKGLFGEVFLINLLLDEELDPLRIIDAWTGLQGGSHDFRFGSVAIEVKTNSGNGNTIKISSEHQLDNSQVDQLFLCQHILNVTGSTGVTLKSLVDTVRARLEATTALDAFSTVLIRSGYFETHRARYDEHHYEVRRTNYWHVMGAFPRITPSLMPLAGISDVSYSLTVSHLSPFSVQLSTIVEVIDQKL